MSERRTARRVTMHEARRAFDVGREVLVSEYGHEATHAVGPLNMTHTKKTTTFDELRRQVNEWRGRYPNQRYYVVDPPAGGPQAGDAVRLAAPWPGASEAAAGSMGVLNGMLGEPLGEPSICFNASTYRDDRVVQCSGGPATIATPIDELYPTGTTATVVCWRFKGGVRRAHNGENFTVEVTLWDWYPGGRDSD